MTRPPHPSLATADARSADLAARQHGVVTRAQLLAAGMTARMVDGRVGSGRLVALHRGVYLMGTLRGPLEPPCARPMAAILACGPTSVVSHGWAGWLWGVLPRPPRASDVDVTLPAAARRNRLGIRVHRSRRLGAESICFERDIRITSPARTLVDLSRVMSPGALRRMAARMERVGLLATQEHPGILARSGGRAGAPVLRAAMAELGSDAPERSEAERGFLGLVHRGRLPAPAVNTVVHGHEVDFYWRKEGLVVEVDGFAFHSSRRSFESDRQRDAELAASGIRVIRVTWRQMARQSDATLVLLAQALARAPAKRE